MNKYTGIIQWEHTYDGYVPDPELIHVYAENDEAASRAVYAEHERVCRAIIDANAQEDAGTLPENFKWPKEVYIPDSHYNTWEELSNWCNIELYYLFPGHLRNLA